MKKRLKRIIGPYTIFLIVLAIIIFIVNLKKSEQTIPIILLLMALLSYKIDRLETKTSRTK